ncbi:MAG TPA: copper resistance protein CopC [Miltoncostaea sp.]|nr:copper resistance protein CopC [Miltoncostaea sp.]
MSTRTRAAALAVVALAGAAGVAVAHEEVEGTTPARGAVLRTLPAKVSMTLGESVGRLDTVTITRNGRGNFVKGSGIDPRNAARVVATLTRPGPRFRKGLWKVTWRITAADGDRQVLTAGFRVR